MIASISSTVRSRSSLTTTWSACSTPDRLFVLGLAQPGEHLVARVAAAAEPTLLLLARRREHEDQDRLRVLLLDLLGAVELDLEHDVGRGRVVEPLRARRAVVVAEELGPLEEAALGLVPLELGRSW